MKKIINPEHIIVSRETKKKLDALGNKGDTYEDIIKSLLNKKERFK